MNILTAYTLKYLRLNRKRTAVTVLGVVLSSALVCGVILLGVSFQKLMIDHEIATMGQWHARVLAVPSAKVTAITENRAVQAAMLSAPLGNATYGSRNAVRPYLTITAYDAPSFQTRPIKLIAGRLPQNGDELLISEVVVADSGLGLAPGSTLNVTVGRRSFPNHDALVKAWAGEEYVSLQDGETFIPSVSRSYTVVGIMAPLYEETSMPAAFPAVTYLDPAHLAAADTVDVSILVHDPRSVYTSAPEVAKSAGLEAPTGADGQPAETIVYNEDLLTWIGASNRSNYGRFFVAIIATLIAVIVLGSALVIYNAFAISIGERTKQFGMFASVGATTAQIRRIVLTEAGVITAVGIPLGVLGAIAGVGILLKLTQGIISQLIVDADQGMQLVVSPLVIGLTILFSTATVLLSAWIPARRASRVSPMDAIRQRGEIQDGAPLSMYSSPLIRRVLGFEGELALRAFQRDRKRYRATVLSLMISIILFVAFNALMLYTTTTQNMASKAMNFDLIVDLDYRQSHANDFASRVSQLPEVQRVTFRRSTYQQYVVPRSAMTDEAYRALQELDSGKTGRRGSYELLEDGSVQFVLEVSAVGPAEFAHYAGRLGLDVQQYSDPSAPLGILVNHTNVRQGGKLYDFDLFTLKPGDLMTIHPVSSHASPVSGHSSPNSGDESPASLTWTVGAVTQETPLGFLGVTLVPMLIVSDAVFDGLHDQLLTFGPINPGAMYIQSDAPEAAVDAIKRLYAATVAGNFSYWSVQDFNRAKVLKALLINLFFYGFLTLITLISVANMVNTLDTNLKLRRREIAMLKSVGLTPGGLQRMLCYESLFYGLTALLFGSPLGVVLSVFIYSQFDGVSAFAFTLPWGAILACVAGVLTIVFATMMASGAMIRNDNLVETIKQENL